MGVQSNICLCLLKLRGKAAQRITAKDKNITKGNTHVYSACCAFKSQLAANTSGYSVSAV